MGAEILDIRVTEVGSSLYVALDGELDLYTSPGLTPLYNDVSKGTVSDIDLDLTHLKYVDSTGLMQIVRLYRSARGHHGSLTVHVLEGSVVQRVLRLIGAGDLFPVIIEAKGSTRPVAFRDGNEPPQSDPLK